MVRVAAAIVLACALFEAVRAGTLEDDAAAFNAAVRAANRENWAAAQEFAGQVSDAVTFDVIEWMRLRAGVEDLGKYVAFLEKNWDWPGLKLLRRTGESALTEDVPPSEILEFFKMQEPQTANGSIRLAQAFQQLGLPNNARAVIIRAWRDLDFSKEEQSEVLEHFADLLSAHHVARIDNLLWDGRTEEAERTLHLVDSDHRVLFRTRMALRRGETGVDARIRSVPAHLKNDPGLAYERLLWRNRAGNFNSANEILLERSVSAESLGRPEKWAQERHRLAHRMMRANKAQTAYRLASSHFLEEGPEFANLEWLAGYLALRKLNDRKAAIRHFQNFTAAVDTPISNGRAGYWLGLAFQAEGNSAAAHSAFEYSAQFQTSFYGQLAAEKIDAKTDRSLIGNRTILDASKSNLNNDPVVRAALLYHHSGNPPFSAWFMAHRAETLDERQTAQLAAIARLHGAEFSAIKVAKEGLKRGHANIRYLFPLTGIEKYELPVPAELALAVARQETEFNPLAASPAGALGLMQLMPRTGSAMAKRIGITGSPSVYLRNNRKNVLLGSEYISARLEDYTGSYIMAFAAYNAGPGRLKDWLGEFGDPRSPNIDPIDWIEHIPFSETRNYVMRVMEAVTVYRMRLSGTAHPIRITVDLERG